MRIDLQLVAVSNPDLLGVCSPCFSFQRLTLSNGKFKNIKIMSMWLFTKLQWWWGMIQPLLDSQHMKRYLIGATSNLAAAVTLKPSWEPRNKRNDCSSWLNKRLVVAFKGKLFFFFFLDKLVSAQLLHKNLKLLSWILGWWCFSHVCF